MSIFFNEDNYKFFRKVRNFDKNTNEIEFRDNLSNTARDLLICTMPSIMDSSDIFPILYTDDRDLREAYKDLQPDFILHLGSFNRVSHIYLDVFEEYHQNKNFTEFFTESNYDKRTEKSNDSSILFSELVKHREDDLINILKQKIKK